MKIHRGAAALLLAALCTGLPAGGVPEAATDSDPAQILASLDWLAGHWRGAHGSGTWEAIYSTPEGGLILSLNKQVTDGKLQVFEIEQFRVQGGAVVMAPLPFGKPSPVVFTLTEWDAEERRAVFENPEHDFPQILVYHRRAEDRLHVAAHAMREGQRVGFELDLTLQPETP